MKMMKRMLAFLLMLVMCCSLTACKKDEPADADVVVPEGVMLIVGDYELTREKYEEYLATLTNYYANYGYDASTDASLAQMLQQFALQTGIEYAVLDQKLVELGLALTDEEKAAAKESAKAEWDATVEDGLATMASPPSPPRRSAAPRSSPCWLSWSPWATPRRAIWRTRWSSPATTSSSPM